VRDRAKPQFLSMKNETDVQKIESAVKKTEFIIDQLQEMSLFHKYRTLKKNYSNDWIEELDSKILQNQEKWK